MDRVTIQAKVNGAWQEAPFSWYGDTVIEMLGAMAGQEVIVKWEPEGEEIWYYCGTNQLANSMKVKTKFVLTINQLIDIYHKRRRK